MKDIWSTAIRMILDVPTLLVSKIEMGIFGYRQGDRRTSIYA